MLYKVTLVSESGSEYGVVRNSGFKISENFTAGELACQFTNEVRVSKVFIEKLQDVRASFGRAMYVTSCCRSALHNKRVGGHERSLHLMYNPYHKTMGTVAVDISTNSYSEKEKADLIDLAYSKGMSVGIGKNFVHMDNRQEILLPQHIWNY